MSSELRGGRYKLTSRDPTFIRKFKAEHVAEVWVAHSTKGNKLVSSLVPRRVCAHVQEEDVP